MHAERWVAKPLSAGLWQLLIKGGGQPKAGEQQGACKTAVLEDPYLLVSVLTLLQSGCISGSQQAAAIRIKVAHS